MVQIVQDTASSCLKHFVLFFFIATSHPAWEQIVDHHPHNSQMFLNNELTKLWYIIFPGLQPQLCRLLKRSKLTKRVFSSKSCIMYIPNIDAPKRPSCFQLVCEVCYMSIFSEAVFFFFNRICLLKNSFLNFPRIIKPLICQNFPFLFH